MREAKILIVEDEGVTALSVKSLLENWGYQDPLIALSGAMAIQDVAKFNPDLILMDIKLSEDVDGIEIAKELQNDFDIPIVYLTAHSDETTIERAKLTGPYGYIVKPFSNDELKVAIDTALYRHKLENELKKANKLLQIELEKRKYAEEELKKSEEKYRTIVETTHEGIVIFNEKNEIGYVNKQMAELLGYKVEEMNGSHVFNFINDKDHLMVQNELKPRGKSITCNLELSLRKKDGSYVWTLISGNTLFDSKDNFIGILCVIKDISERKEYENELENGRDNLEVMVQERTEKLQISNETLIQEIIEREKVEKKLIESERRLKIAMDMAKLVYWEYDVSSDLFTFDDHFYKLYGTTSKEEGGSKMSSQEYAKRFIPPEESHIVAEEIAKSLKTDDPNFFRQVEHSIIRADGEKRFIIVRHGIITDDRGRTIKTYGANQDITERKKAEENLKESEEKYRSLFQSSPYYTIILGIDGKIMDVNNTAERFAGLGKSELIGKHFTDLDIFPMEEVQLHVGKVSRLLKEGHIKPYESKLFDGEGKLHYVKNYLAPLKKNDEIFGFQVISRDVTRHKNAEEGKKREHQKLMDIIEFLPDATFVIDHDSKVIAWNRAIEKITGLSKKEILGKGDYIYSIPFYGFKRPILIDLILSQDNEAESLYDHVGREGDTIYGDVFIPHMFGGKGAFLWGKASPLYDDKGNFVGAIESIRDISERKKSEDEINKNLKRLDILNKVILTANRSNNLKSLINDTLDLALGFMDFKEGGIYLIDLDERIAKLERFTESPDYFTNAIDNIKIDEYPFREVYILGKSLFIGKLDRNFPEMSKSQNFKSLAVVPLYSEEKIIGSFNITNKKKHNFTQKEKEIIKSIGREIGNSISKLITEEKMKKLITELKLSNDELQQFAYITSHDLQEPLRTIASFTQLLERRYKDKLDTDADEFIDYIIEASVRMKQMINDLLEYSRLVRVEKKCKSLRSENILLNVLNSLNSIIKENNAEITYDSLPSLIADENQLAIVFQNLIENAIKFKRENIPLKIHISAHTDKESNEHVFNVSDNGIGIEKQYFDRIFIIFQRLHTRDEYQGTGIGLSISKRIIEGHGGRMWVESEPNAGSTFYFTIPLNN